ncbi:hypothetical protein Tsubulata_003893 [Turnera subulata]|uniref:Uncharacterized protein n=1 Tax=Turnera subulata TaxID=218843 RepID=A0A9Q0GI13_9ROSI|nr:hypothetical protein Tsubulata_003893 [Turnera subulata]
MNHLMAEPVADLEFTFDEIPQNKPLNFGGRNVWPQIAFFLVCLRNLFEVPDADVNGKIFVGRYCCRLLHRDIPGQDGGTITEWGTISERIIRYFRSHAPTPSELVRYLHRDYRNPVQFQQVPLEMHYPPEVVDSYEQAAAELFD